MTSACIGVPVRMRFIQIIVALQHHQRRCASDKLPAASHGHNGVCHAPRKRRVTAAFPTRRLAHIVGTDPLRASVRRSSAGR